MRNSKKIEVVEYFCDQCGSQLTGYDDCDFYVNADIWDIEAADSGWCEIDGKHYCPDCWRYDDDNPTPIPPIHTIKR